jgi:CRP-like cAMP-binding protein
LTTLWRPATLAREEGRLPDVTDPHLIDDPRGNRLLGALPDAAYQRIAAHLDLTDLRLRMILSRPDERVDFAYFPLVGAVSLIAFDASGDGVEVGAVGSEGAHGIPAVLADATLPIQAIVQLPGRAARLPADVVRAEFRQGAEFTDLLLRYNAALYVQTSQSVACNRLHPLTKRAARWLLAMHDRVPGDELPLTHDFLAGMLGTARPKVSTVLARLDRSGLTKSGRGNVTVLDRAGLEATACECYSIIRCEYERLLGAPVG